MLWDHTTTREGHDISHGNRALPRESALRSPTRNWRYGQQTKDEELGGAKGFFCWEKGFEVGTGASDS